MYRVLYRKWRPAVFTDVSGQEHITSTLQNEVSSGRHNHAYLFTGSRGTGKTTCAKILAKAVNCLNPQNGNPCGECEICKGIDDGSILDIVEMDAASNRKIDDIRQIIDEVQFKPAKCKYRVYIVDEVHMLTTEAFNALLKTLEEPPEHVIFILATTEVHKLPQTIRSRCQRFDFHRIPPKAIADRVEYVVSQENAEITESAALMLASVADGALRDALSLLDSCLAVSSHIDEEVVRNAAGLVSKTYLFELATAIINKNPTRSLEIIDRLYSESKDMARLCDELVEHFRALMLIKTIKNPRDILIISTPADTPRFQDLLGDGHQFGVNLQYAVQPSPDGLAQAFIIVADFIGDEPVAMVLGDNIFAGHGLKKRLKAAVENAETGKGATVFGYYVDDPERFGIVEFDHEGKAISIEEKPAQPKSNYCVTGLYFYDNNVVKYAKELKPSARGELEITDLNRVYLEKGDLNVELLGQGFTWLDTGTHESLVDATNFVKTVETHQHRKIACLEEIAYLNGWISKDEVMEVYEVLKKNQYGQYLKDVLDGKYRENLY